MPSHMVLILKTSTPSTMDQESGQRKVVDWMNAFHIDFKEIDAAEPLNKALRDELFSISGKRGHFPQVFLTNKSDSTAFVGDFTEVQQLIENNNLPESLGVKRFESVFSVAKKA